MRDYMKTVLNGLKQYIEGIKGADVPVALPNPHALHLTGAVEATYDGSEPVEVVIPQGGGGLGNMRVIRTIKIEEGVSAYEVSTDENGNPFSLTEMILYSTSLNG